MGFMIGEGSVTGEVFAAHCKGEGKLIVEDTV